MEHTTLSPPLCSKHGSEKVWRKDRNHKDGGRWRCLECYNATVRAGYPTSAGRKRDQARHLSNHPEAKPRGPVLSPEARKENDREKSRNWYLANTERRKESAKSWRKANPGKTKASNKAWREANREKCRSYSSAWTKRNPEKSLANVHRREARKRAATSPFAVVTAAAIAERFALTDGCAYCGANAKLTADHVVPLNDGGLHVPSNLVGACGRCNSSKQDKPVEAWFRAQPFFSEQRWQRIQTITGDGQLSLI